MSVSKNCFTEQAANNFRVLESFSGELMKEVSTGRLSRNSWRGYYGKARPAVRVWLNILFTTCLWPIQRLA